MIQDMRTNIFDYMHSCEKVRRGITKLSSEIAAARVHGMPAADLLDRRCLLYEELSDMLGSIRLMQDYVDKTEPKSAIAE